MAGSEFALAARLPEAPIFIEDDGPVTFGELLSRRDRLARELGELPAGRVAIYSNLPSRLAVALGACAGGKHELLILRSGNDPRTLAERLGASAYLDRELTVCSLPSRPECPRGGDILIGTSGTTGTPKIARHHMATLAGRIRPARSKTSCPRWLLTYEAGAFAGLQMVLTALLTDSVLVASSDRSVPALAAAVRRHNVTHISATPTFWRAFLVCVGSAAPDLRIEQITLGGEIVHQSILDHLQAAFPAATVCHIYASTEAGALFSVRDGCSGFPSRWLTSEVEGVSLRIRNDILEVRSPRSMTDYADGRVGAYTDDGWLHTGDRVRICGDRVHFAGRQDSMINVGGAKVLAEEIETALIGIPGVVDLRALPITNPITGAIIGVEVIAAPDADRHHLTAEILRVGRAKLDPVRSPRVVRFVDEITIDASGKKSRAHAI